MNRFCGGGRVGDGGGGWVGYVGGWVGGEGCGAWVGDGAWVWGEGGYCKPLSHQ